VCVVKPINHGVKILSLRRPPNNQNWFYGPLQASRLHDLVYTGYAIVPHPSLKTLCESRTRTRSMITCSCCLGLFFTFRILMTLVRMFVF